MPEDLLLSDDPMSRTDETPAARGSSAPPPAFPEPPLGRSPVPGGFDVRSLAMGTLRRWPVIAGCLALSLVGAQVVSPKVAALDKKSEFRGETILSYAATGDDARYVDAKTAVLTLKDTVKVRENVAQARDRAGLTGVDLGIIGKALDVRVQKNTTLLVIEAKWTSPRVAADLANALRDVFLENYRTASKDKVQGQINDLNRRLARVRADLRSQDSHLQGFTSANRIVDIDKESRALLEEYNNYGVLLEQAEADRRTVEEQAIKLDKAIDELKARVNKESASMSSLESLSDVNTRLNRLQEAIHENREARQNQITLDLRRVEMERAKTLYDKGFLSEADYRKAVAAFETQQIVTEDNPDIKRWKQERERLQKRLAPRPGEGAAPSAPILQTMLMRTFDIQLQRIAVQKKVQSLQAARNRVKARLDLMPGFQQQYDALERNIAARETERKDLEERISSKSRALDSRQGDFTVVSNAVPEEDTGNGKIRKILPLLPPLFGTLGVLIGLVLAAALALLDKNIRTPRALAAALPGGMSVLGALPRLRRGGPDATFAERLALTARRIRQAAPRQGVRLLLAAPTAGEGATTVTLNLAASLGRQGERVALVDLRPDRSDVADTLLSGAPSSDPLKEGEEVEERVTPPEGAGPLSRPQRTSQQNVWYVSSGAAAGDLDVLVGAELRRQLQGLSQSFDVVLVRAAPVLSSSAAEILAGHSDAAVLVAGGGRTRPAILQRALDKLTRSRTPILGVILNRAIGQWD